MNYFPPSEVERTGANFLDVDPYSYGLLNCMRERLGIPMYLIRNGITTGKHRARQHAQGKAFDFHLNGKGTPDRVVYAALHAGFRGIGVYWNGRAHSYHVDTRENYTFWKAERVGPDWVYKPVYRAGGGL